jgi:hypothetical protein
VLLAASSVQGVCASLVPIAAPMSAPNECLQALLGGTVAGHPVAIDAT